MLKLYWAGSVVIIFTAQNAQKQLVTGTARSDQYTAVTKGDVTWRDVTWRNMTWRDVTSHGAARYVMLNSLLLLRHNNFFLRKLPRNFSELNDIESRTLTQFLSVRYITCCTVRTSTQTCCVRADRLYYNWHTHNSCFGHYECSSVYLPLPLPLHESKDAEEAASWDCLK